MIYVFKTSVQSKMQARKLAPHLNSFLVKDSWNFDLQDRDRILRVSSKENIVMPVKDVLKEHNFECEELE